MQIIKGAYYEKNIRKGFRIFVMICEVSMVKNSKKMDRTLTSFLIVNVTNSDIFKPLLSMNFNTNNLHLMEPTRNNKQL